MCGMKYHFISEFHKVAVSGEYYSICANFGLLSEQLVFLVFIIALVFKFFPT